MPTGSNSVRSIFLHQPFGEWDRGVTGRLADPRATAAATTQRGENEGENDRAERVGSALLLNERPSQVLMWGTQSTCGVSEGLATCSWQACSELKRSRLLSERCTDVCSCLISYRGILSRRHIHDPTINLGHGSRLPPGLWSRSFAQHTAQGTPVHASSRLFACPQRRRAFRIAVARSSNDADLRLHALSAQDHGHSQILFDVTPNLFEYVGSHTISHLHR